MEANPRGGGALSLEAGVGGGGLGTRSSQVRLFWAGPERGQGETWVGVSIGGGSEGGYAGRLPRNGRLQSVRTSKDWGSQGREKAHAVSRQKNWHLSQPRDHLTDNLSDLG